MRISVSERTTFGETAIDRVRDYWNARPCNLRHSPAPVGTRQYFDEVEARKYFVEPHIPGFAEFQRWSGKRVLEIGCGLGTDTINFARAGAHVTAVELSTRSLDLARQRADVFGLSDRITFVEANAERLSECVPASPYDLVYSFGVIHHTPHPARVLQQIRANYAGPQTTLKLMVYSRWSWKVLAIVLREAHGMFWKLDEVVARHSEAQTGCPVTYTYTRRTPRDDCSRRTDSTWTTCSSTTSFRITCPTTSSTATARRCRSAGFPTPPCVHWNAASAGTCA